MKEAARSSAAGALAGAMVLLAGCGTGRPGIAAVSPGPVCSGAAAPATTARLEPVAAGPLRRFHLDLGKPVAILAGADGRIWFDEDQTARVGALAADGTVTYYPLPRGSSTALDMAQAADGSLWVPTGDHGSAFHLVPGGSSRDCRVGSVLDKPWGAALAPDGTVLLALNGGAAVARLDPAHGVRRISLGQGAVPQELAPAAAGGFWVSDFQHDALVRVDGDRVAQTVPLGSPSGPIAVMTVPADAAGEARTWFAEYQGSAVGWIDRAGTVGHLYRTPTPDSGSQGLALGRDGAIWFTESKVNRVGRLDPASGRIREWEVGGNWPDHIAVAADGGVWFSEYYSGEVVRLQP